MKLLDAYHPRHRAGERRHPDYAQHQGFPGQHAGHPRPLHSLDEGCVSCAELSESSATSDVAQRLFDGLKRLEYRGYDCAGICTIEGGELVRRRAEGKLDNLARELARDPLHGVTGIAHTRWATHGAPTVGNAHPHIVGPVALVHNGIIENFKPLRDELIAQGRTFQSETDTEVVAHLVAREVEGGASPQDAVAAVLAAAARRLRDRLPVPRPSRTCSSARGWARR